MRLPPTREAAISAYAEIMEEAAKGEDRVQRLLEAQRQLALADLFFLLVGVLDRGDANRDWIFARCREVQAAPNGYLDLWAREHYKSTIITFALTIFDILHDPEVTIGIFSFNRPTAKAFLRQIKREFETNELLRSLFPDIIWRNPSQEAPKWSEEEGIILRRRGNPKESSIEAWGLVDAQPTSKHFQIMIYDDVVTRDTVTHGMIPKTNEAWEASLNLGTENGVSRYIGTRWNLNDTYRLILERGAAIERRHPVTKEGTAEGEPVLWTRERVAERRRSQGPYTFASQMLLDPTADRTQGFRDEWLRYYRAGRDASFSRMTKYILVDPASAKKATSDYTAMGVVGLGEDANYYLLDAIRDRLNLKERGDALFALHRKWKPNGVGYEKYGMQADIEYYKERMADEAYRFEITELAWMPTDHSKPDRIRRLVPLFEAGRFVLPERIARIDYEGRPVDVLAQLLDEYRAFPVSLHDDLLDMLSRITDPSLRVVWPKPQEQQSVLPPQQSYDPFGSYRGIARQRDYDPFRQRTMH